MANFNYLDFFKTPVPNDNKLFIKDKNNNIVWTISTFKISSYIVQNNNIRINFTNGDFIIIDFNNVYESKYALSKLKDTIALLNNRIPFDINKDIKLYIDDQIYLQNLAMSNSDNIIQFIDSSYSGLTLSSTASVFFCNSNYSYTTVNLPDVADMQGKELKFINTDNNYEGYFNINGPFYDESGYYNLNGLGHTLTIISDGNLWWILMQYTP